MTVLIRAARLSDEPALRSLEGLSPEVGRTTIAMTLRIGHFALAARYPGVRGYVAHHEPDGKIVGALFSSTAPTQLDGGLVPATYLFGARVHPAYRRRGIAPALVEHAWQRAQAEGARTAWAAIIEGNDASLTAARSAGFLPLGELRAKLVLPGPAQFRSPSPLRARPAAPDDLPALAALLNSHYAGHNLWRPQTTDRLLAALQAAHHTVADAVVGLGPAGELLGAAIVLNMGRIAHLRLLQTRALPPVANRLLTPLFRLLPLHFLLVHHHAFPARQPSTGASLIAALLRHHLPSAWATMMVADPRDPIWPALDRQWGVSGRIHLVAKGDLPQQPHRPLCLP